MPAALVYAPPDAKYQRGIDDLYEAERNQRIEAYNKAWDYYLGKQKKFLRVKDGEPDDNIAVNLVKMTADRTVNFLYPEIPEFLNLDNEALDYTQNQSWIYNMIQANGGLLLFQKTMLIGFLAGHVYVRIVPPNPAQGQEYPKLIPLSPKNVQTYWLAGDTTTVLWHEVSWKSDDITYVIDFVNQGNSWEILQYKYDRGWTLMPEKSGTWNSPYSPIIHWQHLPNPESFYGLGEAFDMGLQDALNLTLSEATRILRYHASPRTVVKGVEAEDIMETGIENLWVIENPEASVQNLEMISQLEASRQIASLFYDSYLSLQRTVLLRGEVKDFQRVTNTGVRTVFMDSLAKRNTLANQYGQGMANVIHRAALVSGKGDNFRVVVKHVDPLPLDELEQARVDAMKIAAGTMSRQLAVVREGRSWDEHLEQVTEEWVNPIFNPLTASQSPMSQNNEANADSAQ